MTYNVHLPANIHGETVRECVVKLMWLVHQCDWHCDSALSCSVYCSSCFLWDMEMLVQTLSQALRSR